MNKNTIRAAGIAAALTAAASSQAGTTSISLASDYMTSGFFQSNYVRGDEAGSTRAVNRSTSPSIFGVQGETTYFDFNFDPSAFVGPVAKAVFRVEVVANGFFADPSVANPADISIHSLTASPLAAIDDNTQQSFIDFRESQITSSSIVSTTSVDGLGVFEWDITSLVNEWIANGDANLAYSIGAGALLDPDADTAIGFVNSSWAGLTDETVGQIVIVPAPGVASLGLAALGITATRRRR